MPQLNSLPCQDTNLLIKSFENFQFFSPLLSKHKFFTQVAPEKFLDYLVDRGCTFISKVDNHALAKVLDSRLFPKLTSFRLFFGFKIANDPG